MFKIPRNAQKRVWTVSDLENQKKAKLEAQAAFGSI